MSERRPARKRCPEERDDAIATEPETVPLEPATTAKTSTAHDPDGWLILGLFVLMIAAIAFVAVMAWMAA